MKANDFYIEDSMFGDGSYTVANNNVFDTKEDAEKWVQSVIDAEKIISDLMVGMKISEPRYQTALRWLIQRKLK